ncbi:uncharacterized protein B0H18DRAFT_963616 [Fomitopsis serialis]|uniref:uncharacterized protein n=1 Tax=Fomitopsis serialis TaxID=139415 RepID=UPI002007307E|nr:uncharacterized protein B0H18DRAFT_963616 [Neoantrodia serialis]KAH9910234.1 hypothetical protein B0H18DRAFT_963616 [Neoantrodia serialis]
MNETSADNLNGDSSLLCSTTYTRSQHGDASPFCCFPHARNLSGSDTDIDSDSAGQPTSSAVFRDRLHPLPQTPPQINRPIKVASDWSPASRESGGSRFHGVRIRGDMELAGNLGALQPDHFVQKDIPHIEERRCWVLQDILSKLWQLNPAYPDASDNEDASMLHANLDDDDDVSMHHTDSDDDSPTSAQHVVSFPSTRAVSSKNTFLLFRLTRYTALTSGRSLGKQWFWDHRSWDFSIAWPAFRESLNRSAFRVEMQDNVQTSQCDLLTVDVQFRMRGGVVRTIRKKDELGTEFFFCMGVQSVGELTRVPGITRPPSSGRGYARLTGMPHFRTSGLSSATSAMCGGGARLRGLGEGDIALLARHPHGAPVEGAGDLLAHECLNDIIFFLDQSVGHVAHEFVGGLRGFERGALLETTPSGLVDESAITHHTAAPTPGTAYHAYQGRPKPFRRRHLLSIFVHELHLIMIEVCVSETALTSSRRWPSSFDSSRALFAFMFLFVRERHESRAPGQFEGYPSICVKAGRKRVHWDEGEEALDTGGGDRGTTMEKIVDRFRPCLQDGSLSGVDWIYLPRQEFWREMLRMCVLTRRTFNAMALNMGGLSGPRPLYTVHRNRSAPACQWMAQHLPGYTLESSSVGKTRCFTIHGPATSRAAMQWADSRLMDALGSNVQYQCPDPPCPLAPNSKSNSPPIMTTTPGQVCLSLTIAEAEALLNLLDDLPVSTQPLQGVRERLAQSPNIQPSSLEATSLGHNHASIQSTSAAQAPHVLANGEGLEARPKYEKAYLKLAASSNKKSGKRADQAFKSIKNCSKKKSKSTAATAEKQSGPPALKWMNTHAPEGTVSEPVKSFINGLDASLSDNNSLYAIVEALQRDGDRETAFLDDSLSSIIQRCKRMTAVSAATDFLFMVQYLQLVFKCSSLQHLHSLSVNGVYEKQVSI